LTHPFGICAESFTFKTLERTFHLANDPISKEHVTDFILKNPNLFKIKEIVAPKGLERPNWRLTIDHLEDYNLMTQIFSSLYKENSYIIYSELIKFLDNHLDYLKINAMHNKSSKLL
jgi:spore coat polysaccharide biosynthesis protein SpsF (cytidylyltransferase family)